MAITPHPQLIDRIQSIGTAKTSMSLTRLALLSIMAGAFISLGGMLSLAVGFGVPGIAAENPGIQKLLSAMMFPIGLFLIVMFGGELFTGNNAVLMPGCYKGNYGMIHVAKNWTLVWIFNFVGALFFTYLFVYRSGLIDSEPYRGAIVRMAEGKAALPMLTSFLKGIAANWCVCLAVWLALMVETLPAKAIACWIPVAAFVALGYEHSIANMFFIPAGMMAGAEVSVAELFSNLIPVTAGNIVGGMLMVGTLYNYLHAKK